MSRMIPAALVMAAALGVTPVPPDVVNLPPPYPVDEEPAAPAINPKTGQPYRGIPAHAVRKADPVRAYYADGPQPEPIRAMLKRRREATLREREQERAKHQTAVAHES